MISKQKEKIVIGLAYGCHQCIAKKHTSTLHLSDGNTIKFRQSFRGYRGVPSAIIDTNKLPMINAIVLEANDGEEIRLYLKNIH